MADLAEGEHARAQVPFQFIEDYHFAGVLDDVFVGRVSWSFISVSLASLSLIMCPDAVVATNGRHYFPSSIDLTLLQTSTSVTNSCSEYNGIKFHHQVPRQDDMIKRRRLSSHISSIIHCM
jgi:hypothetical protein